MSEAAEELAFYARERPRVVALGFNYDEQCVELDERWKMIKRNRGRPSEHQLTSSNVLNTDGMLPLYEELTIMDQEQMGVILARVDTRNGRDEFVYAKNPLSPRPQKRKRLDTDAIDIEAISILNRAKCETLRMLCEDLVLKISGTKSELITRINKYNSNTVEVFAEAKKDTLQMMCDDMRLPTSGNKTELFYRIFSDK